MDITGFIRGLLMEYLKGQLKDYNAYFRLADKAGYDWQSDPARAAKLGWKALHWVLVNGAPTLEAVKKDLKLT